MRHPRLIAAVLNGALVLVLPLSYGRLSGVGEVPATVSWTLLVAALPFALLAGWRTWHYSGRVLAKTSRAWLAVLEAGAVGFLTAAIYLAPSIARQPTEAAPYIAVYGLSAAACGLLVGLILRTTALTVLKLTSR